jgi:hypothetical protein
MKPYSPSAATTLSNQGHAPPDTDLGSLCATCRAQCGAPGRPRAVGADSPQGVRGAPAPFS